MDIQWPLAIFTLLTGTAGWTFCFTGLNEFTHDSQKDGFIPGVVSIALLAVGALASVAHLSHPDRIMGALGHPTSGIFTEFVLVMLLGVSILVYLICLKRNAKGGVKVFAVCGMIFGILISFMAGYSYMMAGRAAWDTILLPVAYLGTAVPIGASLYWVLACRDEESSGKAGQFALIGGCVALAAVAVYAAVSGSVTGNGLAYTIAVLCLSGVVPIVCGALEKRKHNVNLAWVVLVATLAGGLVFRVMMWVVGAGFYNFFG